MKKLILLLCVFISATAFAQYTNQKIQVGQAFNDLEFPDTTGKPMKLSEIAKDRVVLLDFWASWCGPCRMASPELVKMYNTYSSQKFGGAPKGFTIVSVSLDQNKQKWLDAIAKDNYTWPYHMSDLGGWGSKPAAVYGVAFIPQCFLINAQGVIVGKYMTATEAENDLKALMNAKAPAKAKKKIFKKKKKTTAK